MPDVGGHASEDGRQGAFRSALSVVLRLAVLDSLDEFLQRIRGDVRPLFFFLHQVIRAAIVTPIFAMRLDHTLLTEELLLDVAIEPGRDHRAVQMSLDVVRVVKRDI